MRKLLMVCRLITMGCGVMTILLLSSCGKKAGEKGEVFDAWQDLIMKTGQSYYAADLDGAIAFADSALLMTKGKDNVLYAKTLNRKAQVLIKMQRVKEAEELALLSLKEAEKTTEPEAISDALNVLGNFYANQGDIIKAKEFYERSLLLAQQISDPMGTGLAMNNLATCMEIGGYYPEALRYYTEAIKVYDVVDSINMIGLFYPNIAALHYQQKEYKLAIKFQKLANEINENSKNTHGLIMGYDNLGAFYTANHQIDSAIYYHQKSLGLVDTVNNDNPRYLFSAYSNLSDAYLQKGEVKSALKFSSKAAAIIDTLKLPYEWSQINLIYARALFKNGDNKVAHQLLKQIDTTAQSLKIPDLQLALFDTYKAMYQDEGNYKQAFEYSQKWQEVKDTVLSQERVAAIEREGVRFKVYEKDKEIAQHQLTNAKQQRWIMFLATLGIGVLLLAGLFYFRSQNMKNKSRFLENEKLLLEEMNERLHSDNRGLLERMQSLSSQTNLAQEQISQIREESIVFTTKNRMSVPLKCKEIKYIEQEGNYSWVVPLDHDKRFQVRGTMKEMEDFLSNFRCFVKVQQSYMVNLDHIIEANRSRLRLVANYVTRDGKTEEEKIEINLGRDFQEKFIQVFEDWKAST
jgi:tetratricopeptide (TPR) repeat protein